MDTFVKEREHAPDRFFETEAAGLRWLAEAEPDGGARTVRPVDVRPGRIELERIHQAPPTPEHALAFGRALAITHDAGTVTFGAPPTGHSGPLYIGSRGMPSGTAETWGAFYAPHRVLPFLDPALQAGYLREEEAVVVKQACDLLVAGALDDDEPAARIHGDLWAGNVLWSADGAVLIDPAAHGGHRETDLAMLALFGTPHLEQILEGYQQVHPLREGWRERIPAHQLHPLAVHAAGHGRSYGVELAAAARQTLALAER